MTQHVRTPPRHERFAFDDRRRLGTTRRATRTDHDNMSFQLNLGDKLLTFKDESW